MSTTQAQFAANRENAQHSTGPTSAAGKATCSRNALRHGLTARGFVIPPGFELDFQDLESGLRIDFAPVGQFQEVLFKRILECAWNLDRCRRAEAQLFESMLDADASSSTQDPTLLDAQAARIAKYARQYENSMYRAIKELRTLQTENQFRHEIHPLTDEEYSTPELYDRTPQSLPITCDYRRISESMSRQWKKMSKPQKQDRQNRANRQREAFEFFERLSAPPVAKRSEAA